MGTRLSNSAAYSADKVQSTFDSRLFAAGGGFSLPASPLVSVDLEI